MAVALAAAHPGPRQSFSRFLTRPLTLLAVALATLPDADLLLRGYHRTATHSLTATALVTIVAILVTALVTLLRSRQSAVGRPQSAVSRQSADRSQGSALASQQSIGRQSGVGSHQSLWVVVVCAAAHASHLLTDWLGADFSKPSGIQLLWPFSDGWFRSGWDIFPQIERRDVLSAASIAINLKALIYELAIMGSIVTALWFWRERSRSSVRFESGGLNDRHQA
jgi:membrane-bound metal-dependent hydrolase YbcI (DUF457 family)